MAYFGPGSPCGRPCQGAVKFKEPSSSHHSSPSAPTQSPLNFCKFPFLYVLAQITQAKGFSQMVFVFLWFLNTECLLDKPVKLQVKAARLSVSQVAGGQGQGRWNLFREVGVATCKAKWSLLEKSSWTHRICSLLE